METSHDSLPAAEASPNESYRKPSVEIRPSVFKNCSSLSSVNLPNATEIKYNIKGYSSLVTLHIAVIIENIDTDAFENTTLSNINLTVGIGEVTYTNETTRMWHNIGPFKSVTVLQ